MNGLTVLHGVYLNEAFAWFVKSILVYMSNPELDNLSAFDSVKSEIVHYSIQVVPSLFVTSKDQELNIISSYNV